jgi:hypothetical protein
VSSINTVAAARSTTRADRPRTVPEAVEVDFDGLFSIAPHQSKGKLKKSGPYGRRTCLAVCDLDFARSRRGLLLLDENALQRVLVSCGGDVLTNFDSSIVCWHDPTDNNG